MRKINYKIPLVCNDVFLAYLSGINKTFSNVSHYVEYPENEKPYYYSVFTVRLGEKLKYKTDVFVNRLQVLYKKGVYK